MKLWIFEAETLVQMLKEAEFVHEHNQVATRRAVAPVIAEIKAELAARGIA